MLVLRGSFAFKTIEQILVLQYYSLASIVLLYYDHILTFPMELKRIWRRRITLSSILFLANRYIVFFGYFFVTYLSFFPGDDTTLCRNFVRVGGYLTLVTQVIISVLLSLRTYALYNRSWKILCFVSLLSLSTVITSALTVNSFFGILMSFGLSIGSVFRTCLPARVVNNNLFRATLILSTVFDSVVFLLTVARTIQMVRQNKKAGARADLPHLLMRDGSIYFAIMVAANLVHVAIFSDKRFTSSLFAQSTGNNAMLSHVISVTMISRLVLNLHGFEDRKRKVAVHPRPPPHQPRRVSDAGSACNESSCETSQDQMEDTTQLTTQISIYSTWLARAADGLDVDTTLNFEEDNEDSFASQSIGTAMGGSSSESLSSFSSESGWIREGEEQDEDRDTPRTEAEDEMSGIKRLSNGHRVWWAQ